MKTLAAAAAVVALTCFVSGCGAEDPTETGTPASPSQRSPEEAPSPTPREAESGKPPSKEPSAKDRDDTKVLVGTVGEADEPEAFTIELTDSSGQPVTALPAGKYQVKVSDPATLHNFHLNGPGVDESTSVAGTGEVTWQVTLEPGSYTFVCDPHPEMTGTVTVT